DHEKGERDDRDEDHRRRKGPPSSVAERFVLDGLVEDLAERDRIVRSEAEHADARFGEDSRSGLENEDHEDVREHIRQDVQEGDAEGAVVVEAGEVYVVAAAEARRLRADGACGPRPGGESDEERDQEEASALLEAAAQEDEDDEVRDDEEEVRREG